MGQNLEELFDVVDERDQVVGQAPRRIVHANGWRHRAIHVLVFNAAGKVFLHQRSMQKDLFPGRWDSSCAGHVGAGEDYDPTAVRELAEELGITAAPPLEKLFKLAAQPMTGWEFVWVYRLRHEGPFVLAPDEIERGDWFEPAAVDRWITDKPEEIAPALQLLWREARDRKVIG